MLSIFKKNILKKDISKEKAYRDYLQVQYDRSLDKYKQEDKSNLEKNRKDEFNKLIEEQYDFLYCKSALVIGCRNSYELDLLEKKGVKEVIGIDLFSFDQRIKIIDMHNMNIFKNNTFDLILSSHSLEHAFDYEKVLDEIYRVIKPGGVLAIEVPVNYKTMGSDIYDFKTAENLKDIILKKRKIKKVLLLQNIPKENNYSGTDISRVIVTFYK